MKAVVLAGGYATRLWPITRHRPKMFLPIGEGTVIDRIFDVLENDTRIEEVFVSTNARFADDFRTYLADRSYEKPTISIEDSTGEDEKFGVVGALAQLVDREGIDDDLLVVAGDNVISFDLSSFIDRFQTAATPTIAAYDVGNRDRATSYGLVELDGDRVVDFQEKPDDPNSTLVSIACYAFPDTTVTEIDTYLNEGGNPDEPGWFIQWLQDREPVTAFTFEEAWFDIGTPESYLDAVAWHLGGDNLIADDATIENVTLGENVHVMPGATISDTYLTDSVVFPDATISGCDLRYSIIDEHTRVEGVDLAGALVGAHSQLSADD